MNNIYRSDCKQVLERCIEEGTKVDLIYLDPPFNSNRAYNIIYDRAAADAQDKAFDDTWSYTPQAVRMLQDFELYLETADELSPVVKAFLSTWIRTIDTSDTSDKKMVAYLIYMTERLVLMHKVLRPSGSLYLHCDPTASHYLKVLMDGIFGKNNFRNEIIWKRRQEKHNLAQKHMGKMHDTILYYAKSSEHIYKIGYTDYDPKYLATHYKHKDNRGVYRSLPATNESGGNKPYTFMGIRRAWRFAAERMQDLHNQGLLTQSTSGGPFYYKKYLKDAKGVPLQDIWDDISPARGKEYLGYKTQKPIELLERIIKSSTNEGDLVLDPFCGCGTTIEAAIKLKRNWIGIDISGDAVDLTIHKRIEKYGLRCKPVEGAPDTRKEYERLSPYEKQDWLIRQLQGQPNSRKSGDQGVDGEMRIHIGYKKEEKKQTDLWGRIIFSVKTGKQCTPSLVRELSGTMRSQKAEMGVLILDKEPTPGMETEADKSGTLPYQLREDQPKDYFPCLQIITTDDIFDRRTVVRPPSIREIMLHRQHAQGKLL